MSLVLPYLTANGRILKIASPSVGPVDPSDTRNITAEPVVKWQGSAQANLTTKTSRSTGQQENIVSTTSIDIPAALAEIDVNDIVTIRFRSMTRDYTVTDIEEYSATGDPFPFYRISVDRRQ